MTPAELRQLEPILERAIERAVYTALERQRKEEVERRAPARQMASGVLLSCGEEK